MSIGVEHGNAEFRRKVIKRNYSNDVIVRAFNITAEYGIPVTVNNIIAFPTETRELVFDTIRLNRKISHAIDTVGCSIFTPFHGTPLREFCIEQGYIDESVLGACVNQGSILAMPQFPIEQIMGLVRTFSLYVRFPESRWPEIEKAEHDTPEGNAVFEELSKEFVDAWYTGESVS
jgi:hypothetical protein